MTREESYNRIDAIIAKYEIDDEYVTITNSKDYDALRMAIKALEQEPCEDEYIKVPKKALKYRTAGMVAYNAEWLKDHFDIERAVICGAQEPCDDVVSRRAAIEIARSNIHYGLDKEYEYSRELLEKTMAEISSLPPITPQPKTGHWIYKQYGGYPEQGNYHCSECDNIDNRTPAYCPHCGAKMVDPQESEVQE